MTNTEIMQRENTLMQQDIESSRRLRMIHRSSGTYVVVEDDESVGDLLSVIIKTRGRSVAVFSGVKAASDFVESAGAENVSCCIIDLNLGRDNGESFVDWLEYNHKDVPVLVYTADEQRGSDVKTKYPWINVLFKNGHHQIKSLMDAIGLRDGPVLLTG
jgi:DNA-binding NtrC family response regulator